MLSDGWLKTPLAGLRFLLVRRNFWEQGFDANLRKSQEKDIGATGGRGDLPIVDAPGQQHNPETVPDCKFSLIKIESIWIALLRWNLPAPCQ